MTSALAPIKVGRETDALISHAAHFLGSSKKDVVDAAVREYVARHREQIQRAALDALRTLDGSTRSAVQLVSGASDDEVEALGGFRS